MSSATVTGLTGCMWSRTGDAVAAGTGDAVAAEAAVGGVTGVVATRAASLALLVR